LISTSPRYLQNTDLLQSLLDLPIPITDKNDDLVFRIKFSELLVAFLKGFRRAGIALSKNGVRLVGSCASHLVTQEAQANPTSDASSLRDLVNDLDVVFHLRKPVHFRHVLKVQEAVVSCLLREKYDIVMSPP